jgi:hypothetical protein
MSATLCRESEEELRNVTLSVKKSWAESSAALHHPTNAARNASPDLLEASGSSSSPSSSCDATRSSRSSGLVEQLMSEMDQVFHEILAEDVGNYLGHPQSSSCVDAPVPPACIQHEGCIS